MTLEILLGVLILFSAYECWAHQVERKRAIERERELLVAIMAKHTKEFADVMESLRRTPQNKIEEMKIENELAQAAAQLQGVAVQ